MTITAATKREREPELLLLIGILAAVYCLAAWRSWENVARWTVDVEHASARVGYTNAAVTELVPLASALAARVLHRCGKSRALPLTFLLAFGGLSLAAQVAEAPHTRSGWLLAAVPLLGVASVIELLLVVTARMDAPAPADVAAPAIPQRSATSAVRPAATRTPRPAIAPADTTGQADTAQDTGQDTATGDSALYNRLLDLVRTQPDITQAKAAAELGYSARQLRRVGWQRARTEAAQRQPVAA